MTRPALKSAPTVTRLKAGKSSLAAEASSDRIDRTGGRYGAGIIRRVSLCSPGEALGHGFWVDDVFLAQVFDAAQSNAKLLKCRFTHPDWCSDGLGKQLGTIESFAMIDGKPYGDLHFNKSSHKSPNGDLAEYVMTLAEEDPVNFGLSIVFTHDWEAEDLFYEEHIEQVDLKDDSGRVTQTVTQFVSPDPLNVNHYPHARLSELHAADVVDEPAANPNGLFHRENELIAEGTQLADFVLGVTQQAPALSALSSEIAPERIREFFQKQLAKHGLTLFGKDHEVKKKLAEGTKDEEKDVAKTEGDPAASPEEDKPTDEEGDCSADGKKACSDDGDEDEKKPLAADDPRAKLSAYCAALGHEAGAKAFLEGKDLTEALQAENESLRTQLAEANAKLEAFAKSGVAPVNFNAAGDKQRDKANLSSAGGATEEAPDNRTKFAQAIAGSAVDTTQKA